MLMNMTNGSILTTPLDAQGVADNVLNAVADFGLAAIAIAIVALIVIGAIKYRSGGAGSGGGTSIWKILGSVLFLVFLLGLIMVVRNYKNVADSSQGLGQKSLDAVQSTLDKVVE